MFLLLPPPLKLTDINFYPIHIVHYNIRTWHCGTVVVIRLMRQNTIFRIDLNFFPKKKIDLNFSVLITIIII